MAELTFKVPDWYGIHTEFEIALKPGYTALIGPNGAGKTVMLTQLEEQCRAANYGLITYSNFRDGGRGAAETAGFFGDMDTVIASLTMSEGQNLVHNFGNILPKVRKAVEKATKEQKPLVMLLDSLDSGASLNMIEQIKSAFKMIMDDIAAKNGGKNELLYIVNAINDYSFVDKNGENIDVRTGEKIKFTDFDAYKDFIVNYDETHEMPDADSDRDSVAPKKKSSKRGKYRP